MLVVARAGLDAVVKQLIKDTLPKIIMIDSSGNDARKEFTKYVERRIKKSNTEVVENRIPQIDVSFIATVLTSPNPKAKLFNYLQEYLSNDSLKNRDQLLRVAAHFAITTDEVLKDFDVTKIAFDARNDIIHEMDVNLKGSKQGRKKRRVRGAPDMVKYTENVLSIGACFINSVEHKIFGTT